MKYLTISLLITIALLSILILISCSGKPENSEFPTAPDFPAHILKDISNRDILAVYDAVIDPASQTFTITPVKETSQVHFPLTQLYAYVLQITAVHWTPDFWADIKLIHPFPGTGIDAYDPRVIAILPANPDVSFDYPALNVNANNSVLLEPDGYTALFDELGTSIPGNVNPFRAYFKSRPNRRWSSTEYPNETQRWNMDLDGFAGPLVFKLVVDVSTGFPSPPTDFIDNAPEPVMIDAKILRGMTSGGGKAYVRANILDWQGRSDIGGVRIEAPDLFTGTVNLAYSAYGPNSYEYTYTATISNAHHAPEGEYKALVATWDTSTGIYMYNEIPAIVSDDGTLIWAKRSGGAAFDYGNSIDAYSNDSMAVAGTFVGTAVFGEGNPNQTSLVSEGGSDIFVARYNPDGTLAWAKHAGGSDYDYGMAITTLPDHTSVATGEFQNAAVFGKGEPNQVTRNSAGQYDIFIARYNPDGTLMWAKRAGGVDFDDSLGITSLSDNSIVIAGHFESTCIFGPGEPNQATLYSDGDHDIVIAKYNPNGTLAWASRAGGADADYGYAITTLDGDSTVMTGEFWGSCTFGPGEPNQITLTSEGLSDVFIAKFNPDGMLMWAKHAGGSMVDYGRGIATLSDDSAVVTGYFRGTSTFGLGDIHTETLVSAGNEDLFVARYNPDGTLAWAKRAGWTALYGDHGYAISSFPDDSFVIAGDFYEAAYFGEGEINETALISGTGNRDIFVARYYPDGSLTWAKHAGGGSMYDAAYGITSLSDGTCAITGYFDSTGTFGPGDPNQTVLTSAGSWDMYIARFNK
jgi:uncharacterized delta-60 repeat protein